MRGYWLRSGCKRPLKSLKEMQWEIQTEQMWPSKMKIKVKMEIQNGR
jgi:hypothetical protein